MLYLFLCHLYFRSATNVLSCKLSIKLHACGFIVCSFFPFKVVLFSLSKSLCVVDYFIPVPHPLSLKECVTFSGVSASCRLNKLQLMHAHAWPCGLCLVVLVVRAMCLFRFSVSTCTDIDMLDMRRRKHTHYGPFLYTC